MDNKIDVICQNCRDGSIIPLKIRLVDEDEQIQQYIIKQYKETTQTGVYSLPSGVKVQYGEQLRSFECKIESFQREKTIGIIYNPKSQIWKIKV